MNSDPIFYSKTEQKKASHALTDLGKYLLELPVNTLKQLPLDESLLEALIAAKKMPHGNSLRRQTQFIGKLLRKTDHEAIEQALSELQLKDTQHERINQQAVSWRDRLLEGASENNPVALGEFIEQYPQCHRQPLNQLIRNAVKTQEQLKAKPESEKLIAAKQRAERALFELIRDQIES